MPISLKIHKGHSTIKAICRHPQRGHKNNSLPQKIWWKELLIELLNTLAFCFTLGNYKWPDSLFIWFFIGQGDFLLIVLKNLIEKQSTESSTKLKVILMYVFWCLTLLLQQLVKKHILVLIELAFLFDMYWF